MNRCVAVFAAAVAVLCSPVAEARRVPLGDLDGLAQICQVAADGSCAPRALVRARIDGERARAEWEAPAGTDLAGHYRARLSAFRAPLAQADFSFPPREDEVRIRFDLEIDAFWLFASSGSAEVGRGGAVLAVSNGAASLVVPEGSLSSRRTLSLGPDGAAPAAAGLVSNAFAFGPAATGLAGPVSITVAYDPARIPTGNPESAVELVQLIGGVYVPVAGAIVDAALHTVSAPSGTLGTFAALVPVTVQKVVGSGGGTVQAPGGVTLNVPTFALDSSQPITVTQTIDPAPASIPQLSPVFKFGPEGTVFAQPVTISIPFTGDPAHARLFWTRLGSATEYENLGGTVMGNLLVAQVTHFSAGFVGTGPAVRDVSGTQVNTWLTETTSTNVADDLSAPGSIEALIPDGSGGFTRIPGVGTAAGTFTIPGVPDGSYYLHSLRSFYVTTSSAPDLGGYRLGRPDVAVVDPSQLATTRTVLNVGNLNPWQQGDYLELFSWSANAFIFGVAENALTGRPAVGDTALVGLTVDETAFSNSGGANLIDGTKGDAALLIQLSTRPGLINGQPTGPLYQSVSRIFQSAPFTQGSGTTAAMGNFPAAAGDVFADASQANGLSVDLRTTQFAPMTASLHPTFTPSNPSCDPFVNPGVLPSVTFDIQVEPATGVAPGTLLTQFSGLPDMLLLNAPLSGPDLTSGTMFYGTPLAGTFNAFGTIALNCSIPLTVPGLGGAVYLNAGYRQDMAIGPLVASPIVPVMSGPQNLKINGLDFFSAQSGVGTSPTLTWQAPAIGAPSLYSVSVQRLYRDAKNRLRRAPRAIANLQTRDTSITLPQVLTVDPALPTPQFFVLTVIASSNGNPNLADAPNRGLLPDSSATALSAVMTP